MIFLTILCLTLSLFHIGVTDEDLPAKKPEVTVDFDGEIEAVKDGNYKIKEEDDVVILTRETFHPIVLKEKVILVEFYAPWCGHCKQLAPIYSEAAVKLKKHGIKLAKVDATKENDLATEFLVSGYPTLILFRDGVKQEDYDGSRTVDGIVEYMLAKADPNWKPPPSEVLVLTKENFTTTVKQSPLMLVEFYAPWCKHCKQLEPEYEAAAKELKLHSIPLAKVDGTVETEITDEHKVSGYPGLKVFRHGRHYQFDGDRNKDGIVRYMLEQAKPPSKETISLKETKNSMQRLDATVIGFFAEKTSLYDEFIAAGNELRKDFTFLHTFKPEVLEHFKIKPNSVVVFKPEIFQSKYEDPHYVFDKKSGVASEIVRFIIEKSVPLVGLRTRSNRAVRYDSKDVVVVVYYDVSFSHQYIKATQIIRNKILQVAKEYRNYTFAICNEEEWIDEIKMLALEDSGEEVNVGMFVKKKRFRMEPEEDFSSDVLKTFIQSVQQGKIKQYKKSQPIPRKQEGPVRIIVADSYEDEVRDSNKDVLLEFYAPWCGHCKKLEPIYKKLAKKMSDDNLVIAKMDATANDIPEGLKIDGFPTLLFFKAFNKDVPILYEGDRSFNDLKSFVNKHSTVFLTEEERNPNHTEL